jgi:hypothetical protein
MVEYLKTKKGYFYKLNKNGEKKRISQEEYNKKNKTRKNIKMIGGGKKEQEIIDELKEKGKFEEWKKLGSYFGLTSNTSKLKDFMVRPYRYFNIDGEIVSVSMINKNYVDKTDVDNIAVFKQILEEDPTHVDPSKYRLEEGTLSTSGLATCTGLAMIIGTKKFMTHLAATTPIEPIIDAIKKEIFTENINPELLKPFIYAGFIHSDVTLQKAKDICLLLGIPEKNYKVSYVSMMDRVSI